MGVIPVYILRVEEKTAQPYEQVRDATYNLLQMRAIQEWADKARAGVQVKIEREDLLQPAK